MLITLLKKINTDHDLIYIFIRALLIYIYAIFLIRVANKRYHFETAFDFILVIIVGSVLSRAINGSSTLLAAIIGSVSLILLHWLFAITTFHSHRLGTFIKGKSYILIKDGILNWDILKLNQITEKDLQELCRLKLHHDNLNKVKEARLERSGTISFLTE